MTSSGIPIRQINGHTLVVCCLVSFSAPSGSQSAEMFANLQNLNTNKDFELTDVQSDSINSIKFSPKANYIVAGSWDNIVRSGCLRTCLSLALCLCVLVYCM